MKFENECWDHFKGETWKREINVRDFIQSNYTPYEGDDSFLVASSEKTRKVWNKLTEMFKVEREKGVYDAETKLPQGIDVYGPGYIDKENEVIVGLQTDAPLKRGRPVICISSDIPEAGIILNSSYSFLDNRSNSKTS